MTGPVVQFAQQRVTLINAALVEDVDGSNYGNERLDWDNAEQVDAPGCVIAPLPVGEQVDPGRDAIVTRWQFIGPPGTPITALSRVEYGGRTYEVDGDPQVFETGVMDHVEAVLQQVRG